MQAWLDLNEVRYSPHVKFTGKTGFDHQFDFLIPKSKVRPERLVKVLARPNRDTAQSAAFSWVDTKEARPPNSSAYAILNDSDIPPAPSVIEALSNYDVRPVLWSDRESARADLAA